MASSGIGFRISWVLPVDQACCYPVGEGFGVLHAVLFVLVDGVPLVITREHPKRPLVAKYSISGIDVAGGRHGFEVLLPLVEGIVESLKALGVHLVSENGHNLVGFLVLWSILQLLPYRQSVVVDCLNLVLELRRVKGGNRLNGDHLALLSLLPEIYPFVLGLVRSIVNLVAPLTTDCVGSVFLESVSSSLLIFGIKLGCELGDLKIDASVKSLAMVGPYRFVFLGQEKRSGIGSRILCVEYGSGLQRVVVRNLRGFLNRLRASYLEYKQDHGRCKASQ